MSPENEEELVKAFPSIYRDYNGDIRTTAMAWGFECGDGWADLIYELSAKLDDLPIKVVASQVKEKFGGLRFYCHFLPDDEMDDDKYNDATIEADRLIAEAEKDSSVICEVCGAPGEINKKGHWKECRCEECRNG